MATILPLLIRLDGKMIPVRADINWSIMQLKQYLYVHTNKTPEHLRIVFAGSELPNTLILKNCQFAEGTVVHVVASTIEDVSSHSKPVPVSHVAPKQNGINVASGNSQVSRRECFYVFCNDDRCNTVKCGKLRVCCKSCKDEAFELARGPCNWSDVLTPNQIEGRCNNKGCSNIIAEFFFKCIDARYEEHRVTPLPLLRTNIKDVPCIACTGNEEIVLIFPCNSLHVICTECFATFCRSQLDCRQFKLVNEIGYTLPCLGTEDTCSTSYIKDIHHFLIAGKQQYERYKNFATEEYLLQNGGLFCPGEGCGNGIFTDIESRKVICHKSRGGCGKIFCRNCRSNYHDGECKASRQQQRTSESNEFVSIDEYNALQARWRDERLSMEKIEASTKLCPNCQSPIEKSGGCNHMTCTRCHFEWCWICVIPWGRSCESDHWFRAS